MSRPPFPIEIDASRTPEGGPLGMSAERFLRDYWQQRPLLVRNAFPGFVSPIEPDDLAGLACEDGVLARIVEHDRAADRYRLRTGPFPEDAFPGMPDHDWTLLVQDVDKWDADIAALLESFRFLPRWRIDDIMVSFAATGGSVGAHIDQYDVFLLQAHGQRRWQIDARPNPPTAFRDDAELKLLCEFDPSHDWVLDPGDMLYLPPGMPHHGVAVNPCLTFSVGTRAPSSAELITDWLDTVVADADDSVRYRDAGMAPPRDPWEIDALAMGRVIEALNALRMNDPDRLGDWFGRFITMYRAGAEAMPAGDSRPRIEVEWDLRAGGGLHRHPWTRMAWRRARRGARLYVSGQEFALPVADARALAAAAHVDDALYARLSEAGRDAVIALLDAGHYHLLPPDDGDGAEDDDGMEIEGR
ncbi:transcriptional regulator [Lysobacteraceae bacterium NML91-0213]|nr:transcriptional regulator [Xanthomonadaceae bacterium NML91-0213]